MEKTRKGNTIAYKKIMANNWAVAVMLQENEERYMQLENEGKTVPKGKDLIRFPEGRIPTLEEINNRYHLPKIIIRPVTVDNAGYCLQDCELYKYLMERFGFYGSIEKMIYRQWLINLGSVIEAMVVESALHLGIEEESLRKIIKDKKYQATVKLSPESVDRIHKIYTQRNNVHLAPRPGEPDETKKLTITRDDVNSAQEALNELAELLYKNAVPEYEKH